MSKTQLPVPQNEFERLLKLSDYNIDYSEIHEKLDDLTELAAYITGTPISLINLLEANTQWTISNFGMDLAQMPREDTACQYVVLGDTAFEVEDMAKDERFKDKPYVREKPNVRYYFGVPLTSPDGIPIGAMCVMDTKKHELSVEQRKHLQIIADQVMTTIESHHKIVLMRKAMDELKEIQQKISHDIRGPVGGIIGIAEILKDEIKDGNSDEAAHFIDLIRKGGQSVLDLADEILTTYHDQEHKPEAAEQSLTLISLKKKLDNLYQPQAEIKDINLNLNIGEVNQNKEFPKRNLMQIFGNLITNSIKFTSEEGNVEVDISLYETDETILTFRITDDGVGMNEEQLQKIMNENPKSTAGTKNERGYGFGFQLARHLTESLNGKMNVDSKPDQGTSITVKIPVIIE